MPLRLPSLHSWFNPLFLRLHRHAQNHAPQIVLLLGCLSLGVYLGFYLFPVLDPENAVGHVIAAGILFALYVPLFFFARYIPTGGWLRFFLLIGLLFRITLLPIEPSMSDDFYRYVWDGKMQIHGINPYLFPPNSPHTQRFHDSHIHPFVNHPHMRTVYPPVAQMLFLVGHQIHASSAKGIKLLLLLSELFTLFLLSILLRQRGRPLGYLLLYAWCPTVILETMLEGHLDAMAAPFLLGALWMALRYKPWKTGLFLAGALLIKPLPLFAIPVFAWHFRWRNTVKLGFVMLLVAFVTYVPYLSAGPWLFSQMLHYSQKWSFNGFFFYVLDLWFIETANRLMLAGAIILCSLIAPFLRTSLEIRFLIPLSAYLLFTHTFYPWYFLWIAPWLALAPSPWMLWLAGSIQLAHTVHAFFLQTGVWKLPFPLMILEFAPVYTLILWGFWNAYRRWRLRIFGPRISQPRRYSFPESPPPSPTTLQTGRWHY